MHDLRDKRAHQDISDHLVVSSAQCTKDFAYATLESASCWPVNFFCGGKLSGAAVGTTSSAFVDTGTSCFAGPTKDVKIATSLCVTTTVLPSPEHRGLQCHEQFRVHRGWCRVRIRLADVLETLQILFSTTSVHKRVPRWQPLRAACLVETVPRPASTSTFPPLATSTSSSSVLSSGHTAKV